MKHDEADRTINVETRESVTASVVVFVTIRDALSLTIRATADSEQISEIKKLRCLLLYCVWVRESKS